MLNQLSKGETGDTKRKKPTGRLALVRKARLRGYKKYWVFYLLTLIPMAFVIVFSYLPMYGIVIAFKDYRIKRGILGSDWAGLKHFEAAFKDRFFRRALGNTVRIGGIQWLIATPLTIIFALQINELTNMRFKKAVQTISYMPYFLSWVVMSSLVYQLLSPNGGVINILLVKLGIIEEPRYWMIDRGAFMPIFIGFNTWKTIGYSTIIYLAAIAGIDQELYEAAYLDGAGRWRRAIHITIPGISATIATLFILSTGNLISVNFDAIFNLYNSSTEPVADVIGTFVYRRGLQDLKYDYAAAVGLFQNVVALLLLLGGNFIVKRINRDHRII